MRDKIYSGTVPFSNAKLSTGAITKSCAYIADMVKFLYWPIVCANNFCEINVFSLFPRETMNISVLSIYLQHST